MIYTSKLANIKSTNVYILYRSNERGIALIVVLLFLILIMLAGVMAVRQSHTDLKTATADQINSILLQSSDSANERLESVVNGATTSTDYSDMVLQGSGIFGYFLSNPDNAGNEFVYCYNPRNRKYQVNNATVYDKNGGTISNNGICDYNNPNHYTSDRQTVITQVSVTTSPNSSSDEAFSNLPEGRDSVAAVGQKPKFDIRSTSAIPSYNEPTGCFAKASVNPASTPAATAVLDCLHSKNTPSKMLYTQATVENSPTTTTCIPLGKGSLNAKCVITPATTP